MKKNRDLLSLVLAITVLISQFVLIVSVGFADTSSGYWSLSKKEVLWVEPYSTGSGSDPVILSDIPYGVTYSREDGNASTVYSGYEYSVTRNEMWFGSNIYITFTWGDLPVKMIPNEKYPIKYQSEGNTGNGIMISSPVSYSSAAYGWGEGSFRNGEKSQDLIAPVPDTDNPENIKIVVELSSGGVHHADYIYIYEWSGLNSEECFTQDDLDAKYEAGKQYCINNPEECGITSTPVCSEVITYGKVPSADCWVMFSTPCDVPKGWETTNQKPDDMCASCEKQQPLSGDNCASFNMFTNILHIPCLDLGESYWLDLTLQGQHLEITDFGSNEKL